MTASEKVLLKFLEHSWRRTDKKQRDSAMLQLKEELDKLKNDPMEGRIQALFYYDIWIDRNLRTGKTA